MIHIAIAEDEKSFRQELILFFRRYSDETGELFDIKEFQDAETLLASYQCEYDILLLDIRMKKMTGMEAAQKIREIDENVIIVFITNLVQYAVQGYSVDAMDFIVKPISYQSFRDKLAKAIVRKKKKQDKYIQLKTDRGIINFKIATIRLFEIVNRKLAIYTTNDIYYSHYTLQVIEQMLKDKCFFRCHVAYLVNLHFIDRVDKNSAFIGSKEILVSKYRKKAFMNALTNFLAEEM